MSVPVYFGPKDSCASHATNSVRHSASEPGRKGLLHSSCEFPLRNFLPSLRFGRYGFTVEDKRNAYSVLVGEREGKRTGKTWT